MVAAVGLGVATTAAVAQSDGEPIVVVEVGGALDQRLIDFITDSLTAEPAHAFILKIDSPGVSSGDLDELFAAVTTAPAPVVAWVGPNPAVA